MFLTGDLKNKNRTLERRNVARGTKSLFFLLPSPFVPLSCTSDQFLRVKTLKTTLFFLVHIVVYKHRVFIVSRAILVSLMQGYSHDTQEQMTSDKTIRKHGKKESRFLCS